MLHSVAWGARYLQDRQSAQFNKQDSAYRELWNLGWLRVQFDCAMTQAGFAGTRIVANGGPGC
jgi:hypothetical protein